jgi:hypothetical protein
MAALNERWAKWCDLLSLDMVQKKPGRMTTPGMQVADDWFLPDAGSGVGGWDVRRAFVEIKAYYRRYLCIVCNALDGA